MQLEAIQINAELVKTNMLYIKPQQLVAMLNSDVYSVNEPLLIILNRRKFSKYYKAEFRIVQAKMCKLN